MASGYKGPSHRKTVIVPALIKKLTNLEDQMLDIMQRGSPSVQREDIKSSHYMMTTINCFLDSQGKYYIGGKQSKKLNKLWQEYQKAKKDFQKKGRNIANESFRGIVRDDGTIVLFKKERPAPPAASKPKNTPAPVKEEEVVPDNWEDACMDF